MIIVIEGPRGSGKSTIALALVERLKQDGIEAEYAKFKRGENPVMDMLLTVQKFEQEPNKVFVIDRFHLTEWVMRRWDMTVEPHKLANGVRLVDDALEKAGAAVVFVGAEGYTREQRIALRNDGRGAELPTKASDQLWSMACKKFWIDYYVDNELQDDFQRSLNFLTLVTKNALQMEAQK